MLSSFWISLILITLLTLDNGLSFSRESNRLAKYPLSQSAKMNEDQSQRSKKVKRKKVVTRRSKRMVVSCPAPDDPEIRKADALANEFRSQGLADILKLIDGPGAYLGYDFADDMLTVNLTEPEESDKHAEQVRKHIPTLMKIADQVYGKKTGISIIWREYAFGPDYRSETYDSADAPPIIHSAPRTKPQK